MDALANRVITGKGSNIRVYLIKKIGYKHNYEAVIFPNGIDEAIKKTYSDNYREFTSGRNVVEYDCVHSEKGAIEKVPLVDLAGWPSMKEAMNDADKKRTILKKETFTDDYSIIVLVYERAAGSTVETVYVISQYRKIDKWYERSVKFGFTTNSLVLKDDDIFVLNGFIDAVIANDTVYILQGIPFERIFNFYEKAQKTVAANKDDIEAWSFIDHPSEFYNSVNGRKGPTTKLARVIEKSAKDFVQLKPKVVRDTLSKHEAFSSISYDDQDRIVFSPTTRDLIIDILRYAYARGLFSDALIKTKGV